MPCTEGSKFSVIIVECGDEQTIFDKHVLLIFYSIYSGPPSAVVNLSAVRSGSSFNISWSAPWSLNVTDVDHDIWYSVLIQNVTDEDRPTDILCTDCTNITETHYTFTPDHLSPCYVYNFTIIPANGAGLGEGVTLSYSFTVEGDKYCFSL